MALHPANEHLGYSALDRERFLDEPAKRKGRTEFARDRARIIHSFALRRLAAKTQVAVPWENDFQRTRLSHSLECAQIGRELGESLVLIRICKTLLVFHMIWDIHLSVTMVKKPWLRSQKILVVLKAMLRVLDY